jgi:hypothetical protein
MVFEAVEISTPAEESPAISWAAVVAGAIAAAALTLVLLAFGPLAWRPPKAGMSGIIGTRVLPAGKPKLNIGGNHGSWNSAVAVRSSNSDHHSSRSLPSLTDRCRPRRTQASLRRAISRAASTLGRRGRAAGALTEGAIGRRLCPAYLRFRLRYDAEIASAPSSRADTVSCHRRR